MVLTSSSAKTENMAISEEIRNNFSDLIKPLAINQSLEEMFSKLKEEIVSKFEEKLQQQINQIEKLEGKLEKQANRINELEGQIALHKKMSDLLEIKCDNNEQYSRRNSIRIHGTEVSENESVDNVMAVVKSCHEKINVPFDQDNIDRVHRIGKKYTDENAGKKVQSIIVKSKSWKSRKEFYDARPRTFVNGKKKPGLNFFNVSVDLTRRCYLLLKTAQGIIKDNPDISYVYADINCSLGIFKQMLFFYFAFGFFK